MLPLTAMSAANAMELIQVIATITNTTRNFFIVYPPIRFCSGWPEQIAHLYLYGYRVERRNNCLR
jgi:hypothetical protein